MPYSFCGIGTKFYGKEQASQADAYLTTEWVVFLYVPIVPIGSFQVGLKEQSNGVEPSKVQRDRPAKVSLQWLHICNVYAALAAIAIVAYLLTSQRTALLNLTSAIAGKPTTPVEVDSGSSDSPAQINIGGDDLIEPVPTLVWPESEPPDESVPIPRAPVSERFTVAEDGAPFPEASGYIKGFEQAFTSGKTVLTVDHAKSNHDIYAKLYNLDVQPPGLASVFLVKASDQFTIETITPGTYELRYRNLETGGLFRTSSFTLEENIDPSTGALVFTHLTLSLYGAIDGDLETYPINENDFEENSQTTLPAS